MSNFNEIFEAITDHWWPLDPDWFKRFDPEWFYEDLEEDPYLEEQKRQEEDYPYDGDKPFIPREPSDGDYGP